MNDSPEAILKDAKEEYLEGLHGLNWNLNRLVQLVGDLEAIEDYDLSDRVDDIVRSIQADVDQVNSLSSFLDILKMF